MSELPESAFYGWHDQKAHCIFEADRRTGDSVPDIQDYYTADQMLAFRAEGIAAAPASLGVEGLSFDALLADLRALEAEINAPSIRFVTGLDQMRWHHEQADKINALIAGLVTLRQRSPSASTQSGNYDEAGGQAGWGDSPGPVDTLIAALRHRAGQPDAPKPYPNMPPIPTAANPPPSYSTTKLTVGVNQQPLYPTGRLFWHGREVETDDDFRAAMLDLANRLGAR